MGRRPERAAWMTNEWSQGTILLILTALMLLFGFRLIWRALIQPDALTRMEIRLDRQRRQLDEQQEEIDELRALMTSDRERLAVMQIEMAEWRAGMRLVFEQLKALDITPVWTPRETPPHYMVTRPTNTLAERIAAQFDITEMNNLAIDIGLDYEEIAGETKEARARGLVRLAERRGLTDALTKRVNKLRGNSWGGVGG